MKEKNCSINIQRNFLLKQNLERADLIWQGRFVPVFDPIGIKRTLLFRVMDLGHVQIIFTTEPSIVVVPYLLSSKKSVVLQAMFMPVVFENSELCKIFAYII